MNDNQYYAGRIVVNVSNIINYKQIISNIINTALLYKSNYILFNTDSSFVDKFHSLLEENGIKSEYATVNGESLVCITLDNNAIMQAKRFNLI